MSRRVQVWLSFRLDLFGCLLVLVTCLLSVGLWESLSASRAGLAISNSFQILLFFSLMVRGLADIDAGISAIDRISALGDVTPEPDRPLSHESCPSEKWPQHGEVEFFNVVMSYAPNTPQVLKGVTFRIHRGEKIGIVGRTGEGSQNAAWSYLGCAGSFHPQPHPAYLRAPRIRQEQPHYDAFPTCESQRGQRAH